MTVLPVGQPEGLCSWMGRAAKGPCDRWALLDAVRRDCRPRPDIPLNVACRGQREFVRKTCLIFNDKAGTAGHIGLVLDRLVTQARFDVLAGKSCDETARLARDARTQYERIIVAGGDGTISRVVNALAPEFDSVELAVLPLGTGNDLARSLHLPLDDPSAALEIAFEGESHLLDVGHVRGATDVYFVNAASGGFGGRVARDVHREDKARWGPVAYWMTAFSKLMKLEPYAVSLEVDGVCHDINVYGIVVANGQFVGGGFPIAPRASLDDGMLDVTTIPVLPMLELLADGISYALGHHEQVERIGFFRGRQIHITSDPPVLFSIDGEPIQSLDSVFEVLPRALRVVAGPKPADPPAHAAAAKTNE